MSTLKITQLNKVASGGGSFAYVPTGVEFVWTVANKAIPHNTWAMPLKQRTSRSDMPGSEEPVEQVLGWNYEPFTLQGLWDDRWLGEQGAYTQMIEFEEMVQEGKMVRVSFNPDNGLGGAISMYGLITDYTPTYRRPDWINYSFTVSPHFRKVNQSTRVIPQTPPLDPKVAVLQALEHAENLADLQAAAGLSTDMSAKLLDLAPNTPRPDLPLAPPFQFADAIGFNIGIELGASFSIIADALGTVNARVLDPLTQGSTALLRMSARFASLKSSLQNMTTQLASASATTKLAFETGIGVLEYECWMRGISATARLAWYDAHVFQKDLARRTDAKAKALYRPYKGESLYGISQRFYNTPHEWRRIMERNGITTLTMAGTELLIIPEITA